ncbi:MAG: helicase associated domain-containing protein [Clostridia bacterium]|nr:helicase associated domain-containing protein [Clostridia bacterium]
MRNKNTSFDKVVELLGEYKREHGSLCVPFRYVTTDGINLGHIVHSIRNEMRKTTEEEKNILNELGFVWKCFDVLSFNEILELFKAYKEEHGDLLVPAKYCTVDGIKLGSIVQKIRVGHRKTTVEQKAKLNELGFAWNVSYGLAFDDVLKMLKLYKSEYGNLLIPALYVTADGTKLGKIVRNIRTGMRRTSVEEKRILNELGFVWKVR